MEYRILKFGAEWCGPCRVLEERLKGFDKCEIEKIDVDSAGQLPLS